MCSPGPGEYARIPMRDRRDTVEVQAKQFLIDHLWSGEAHASERLIIEESVIIAVPTAKASASVQAVCATRAAKPAGPGRVWDANRSK